MESLFLLTNATTSTGTKPKVTAVQFSLSGGKVVPGTGPTVDLPTEVPAGTFYATWFDGTATSDTSVDAIVGSRGSPFELAKYEILSGSLTPSLTKRIPVAGSVSHIAPHPFSAAQSEMSVLTRGPAWIYYVDAQAGTVLGSTELPSGSGVASTLSSDTAWVVTDGTNQILQYATPISDYDVPIRTKALDGAPVGIGGASVPSSDETVVVARSGSIGAAIDTFQYGNINGAPTTNNFAGTPVAMNVMLVSGKYYVWVVTSSPNNLYLLDAGQVSSPLATISLGELRPIDVVAAAGDDGDDDSGTNTGFVHVLASLQ
jgi:hypothetical protein